MSDTTPQKEHAGELVLRVEGLPIPPYALSKNGRDDRRTNAREYAKYREDGRRMTWSALNSGERTYRGETCPALDMVIHWRAPARNWPDDDNAIARCAAYRDGAADAGLVANDRDIRTAGVVFATPRQGEPAEVGLAFYRPAELAAAGSADRSQPLELVPEWRRELAAYLAIWRITLGAAFEAAPAAASVTGALYALEVALSRVESELEDGF